MEFGIPNVAAQSLHRSLCAVRTAKRFEVEFYATVDYVQMVHVTFKYVDPLGIMVEFRPPETYELDHYFEYYRSISEFELAYGLGACE